MGKAGHHRSWKVEPWFIALAMANSLMGVSSILLPLKLDLALHLGPSHLGVMSAFASAAAVLGSLLWGRLSDAAHRRKVFIVSSYVVLGFSHLGMAWAVSYWGLVLHSTLLSFFWIANASVAVLLVIEQQEESSWERRIGALNMSGSLGWLLGLLIAGTCVPLLLKASSAHMGLRTLFLVLSALGFTSAGLAALLVPRTKARFTQRKFRGLMIAVGNMLNEAGRFNPLHIYHRLSIRRLSALRRETSLFLLASMLAFTGIGFFGVPLSMLLSQFLKFSPALVFYGFVMLHIGIVLAYPLALRRIQREGNRRVLIGALSMRVVLFGIASGALWIIPKIPWVSSAVFLFLMGLTWSFFQLSGVAYASRLAKPENRGLALGAYNAIAGASTMVAGLTSGFVAQYAGYHMTFLVAAVLLTGAILVLLGLRDPSRPRETGQTGDVVGDMTE